MGIKWRYINQMATKTPFVEDVTVLTSLVWFQDRLGGLKTVIPDGLWQDIVWHIVLSSDYLLHFLCAAQKYPKIIYHHNSSAACIYTSQRTLFASCINCFNVLCSMIPAANQTWCLCLIGPAWGGHRRHNGFDIWRPRDNAHLLSVSLPLLSIPLLSFHLPARVTCSKLASQPSLCTSLLSLPRPPFFTYSSFSLFHRPSHKDSHLFLTILIHLLFQTFALSTNHLLLNQPLA